MRFSDMDIEFSLGFQTTDRQGSFNQLEWSINTGNDATDIASRVVSKHEYAHQEINLSSGYGLLLQSYALLAREHTPRENYYKKTLKQLIDRCRISHEVFATWNSIEEEKTNLNDNLEDILLAENPEYYFYYKIGEDLVKNIPSLCLKQLAFVGCIGVCFQSRDLLLNAISDLNSFDLSTVRNNDFPDQRLQYLLRQMPKGYLYDCSLKYIESITDARHYEFMKDAMCDKHRESNITKEEKLKHFKYFTRHIYDSVCLLLNGIGYQSLNFDENLEYNEKASKQLNLLLPFIKKNNAIIKSNGPDDSIRNQQIEYEKECLVFSEKQMPCYIVNINGIEDEVARHINKVLESSKSLFIVSRTVISLKAQHSIIKSIGDEILNYSEDYITAIRYVEFVEDIESIFYIPFHNPNDLNDFLRRYFNDLLLPTLGCYTLTAMMKKDWCRKWLDFFKYKCTSHCLVLDISPLFCLENEFIPKKDTKFAQLRLTINYDTKNLTAITYSGMVFIHLNENGEQEIIIFPCSDAFATTIYNNIEEHHPTIIYDVQENNINDNKIFDIFSNFIYGEQNFIFNLQ